jgi:hypothetical protein
MTSFVVLSMVEGNFAVTEIYFDKGGLKALGQNGEYDVTWAKTIREVQESQQDSMYRGGMLLNLERNEMSNIIGMTADDLNQKYGQRSIG